MKFVRHHIPALLVLAILAPPLYANLPATYDLRNIGGQNFVTSVKSQIGGTCWTFGTMASIESNLLMTGAWTANGETGEPNLAEYHLDWWNGFNANSNSDTSLPQGLVVHNGGDYRVATAYLSRGDGAVRDSDGQSYNPPPAYRASGYHYYYPRHVEWYTVGDDLSRIDRVKQAVMAHGVVCTAISYQSQFLAGGYNFYQPPGDPHLPNHSVAIVGWNDNRDTQAPLNGAWLCKNSWGAGWGLNGYFWVSYYDKVAGQDPEMGAVSFQDVEPMPFAHVYYHDLHGWRDTLETAAHAFNAFVATDLEQLEAVSFFTAADDVGYTVTVYDRFEGGVLLDPLASTSGFLECEGFHTIDLDPPVVIPAGDDFFIAVEFTAGGHPYDRSSEVPVLLCGDNTRVWVPSAAEPGQSFYQDDRAWVDLTDLDDSANFCIKGLANPYVPVAIDFPDGVPIALDPRLPNIITVSITPGGEAYVPDTATFHYRYADGDFQTVPLTSIGNDLYTASLQPTDCSTITEFFVSALGSAGNMAYLPRLAPDDVFAAQPGNAHLGLDDDFELDHRWDVVNEDVAAGGWVRAVPARGMGEPGSDFDGSGLCYLTGDGIDLDGGPTLLVSPTFDLAGAYTCTLSYARWFQTFNGSFDRLYVEATDDGGDTWTEVEMVRYNTEWESVQLELLDFIDPTDEVRVRFRVSDNPDDSTTEAAVDAFRIDWITCSDAFLLGDMNCDDIVSAADIDPFVTALTNGEAGYQAAFPDCNYLNADVNGDGVVSAADIDPLVQLLTQ
jgi:C1A family cysteine protease